MLVYIGGVLIGNIDTGIPLITYETPYYKMNLSSEDTSNSIIIFTPSLVVGV